MSRTPLKAVTALLEHVEAPAAVVRSTGAVALCNEPMARLLEVPRREIVGRSWATICEESGADVRARARSGKPRGVVVTGSGRRLVLDLRVDRLDEGVRLVVVVEARPESTLAPFPGGVGERVYEISTRPGEVGVVKEHWSRDGEHAAPLGKPCHLAFWGRPSACHDCPVIPPPAVDDFQERVAVVATGHARQERVLTIGRRSSDDRVRVTIHASPETLLPQLVEARVASASASARLSLREQEVLRLLMRGRSLDEIAAELDISVRTAKYHQSNVLTKLGVESRLDLLRLVH